MKKFFVFAAVAMMSALPVHAAKLAGVELDKTAQVGDQALVLNGAGIRSKFIFDIYVIGLYLPAAQSDASAILSAPPTNRVHMHIVYDKVEKAQFEESFQEGLEDNLSDDELAALSDKIASFTSLFGDVVENDIVQFDFNAQSGTDVIVNGETIGSIPGADFNAALLSIWIGDEPLTRKLKGQLLGN
ncbi:MAG: chalcone isomerase family protein [Pseudomonadota bacterium]